MESCNIYMLETAFFYSAIFLTSTQVVACINYWFFFFFFFFLLSGIPQHGSSTVCLIIHSFTHWRISR